MSAAENWEEIGASGFTTRLSEGFLVREGNTVLKVQEASPGIFLSGWPLSTPRGYQPLPSESKISVFEFDSLTLDAAIETRARQLRNQTEESRRVESVEVYPIKRQDTALGVTPSSNGEESRPSPFLESDLPDGQTTPPEIETEDNARRYINTSVFVRNANGVVIEGKVVDTTSEAAGLLIRSDKGTADYRYFLPSSSLYTERDVDLVSVTSSPGTAPEQTQQDDPRDESPDDDSSELSEDIQDEVTDENPSVGFPDPVTPLMSRFEVVEPRDLRFLSVGDMTFVSSPFVVQTTSADNDDDDESSHLVVGYDGTAKQYIFAPDQQVVYGSIQDLDADDVFVSGDEASEAFGNNRFERQPTVYQPQQSGVEILGASISNPGMGEETYPIIKQDIDSQFDVNPYIRSQSDAEELIAKAGETTQHVIYRTQDGYLNIGNAFNVPNEGAGLVIGKKDNTDPSYKWFLPSSGKQDQNEVELVAIPKQEYIDEGNPTILNGEESVADAIISAASDAEETPSEPTDTGSDDTVADDSEVPDDPADRGQEDVPYDRDFVNDIIERFFEDVTVSFAQTPARALATAFDSLDEIITATPRTLLEIDGVGDGTVERLTGVENPARDIPVEDLRAIDEDQEPVAFDDVDPDTALSQDTVPFEGEFDASDIRQRIKAATRDPPEYIRADALDQDIKAGDLVAYDLMRGAQAWGIVYPEEIPSVTDENGDPRLAAEIFLLGGPGDDGSFVDTYDDDNDGWINTGGYVETQTSVPRDPENFNWVVPNFTGERDGSIAGGGPTEAERQQVFDETQELLQSFTELRNEALSSGLDTSRIDEEINDIQTRLKQLKRLNQGSRGYTRGNLADKTAANKESRQKAEELAVDIDAGDISVDEDAVDTVEQAVETVEAATDAQADEDVVENAVETAQEAASAEGVPESKEEDTEDEVAAAVAKYRSTAPSDDDEPETEPETEPEPEPESEPEPDEDPDDDTDDDELRGPQLDASRNLTEDEEREVVARNVFGDDTQEELGDEFDTSQSVVSRITRKYNNLDGDDKASLDQIILQDYEAEIEASLPEDAQRDKTYPGPTISETNTLTEEQEREIAARSVFGGESQRSIAEDYPLGPSAIGRVIRSYKDITGEEREELETILLGQYDYVIDDEPPEDESDTRDRLRDKVNDDSDESDDMDTEPEPESDPEPDDDDDSDGASDTSIQEEQEPMNMNKPSNIAENRVDAALTAGGVPYDPDDVGIPVEITRDDPQLAWVSSPAAPLPDAIASVMDSSIDVEIQTEQSTDAFLEDVIRGIVGSHNESVRNTFDYDMAFDAADIEPPIVEQGADVDDSPPDDTSAVEDVFEEVFDIVTENTTTQDKREEEAEKILQKKLYEYYPKSKLSGGGMNIELEFGSQAQGVLQGSDTQADGERIVFEAGVADESQYNFFDSENGIVSTPLVDISPEGIDRALSGIIDLLDMRNPSVDEFADITRKFGTIQNLTEFDIEQSTADWANVFLDGEEISEIIYRQPRFIQDSYRPEVRPLTKAMVAAQRVYQAVTGFEPGVNVIKNEIAGNQTVGKPRWFLREAFKRARKNQFDPAAFTYAFYNYAPSLPGGVKPIPDVDVEEMGNVENGMGIQDSGSAQKTAIIEDPEDFTTVWEDLQEEQQQPDTQTQQPQQQTQPTPESNQTDQTQTTKQRQGEQPNRQQQIQQQAEETTSMSERNNKGGGLSSAERQGPEPEPEPEPEPTGNLSDPPLYEGDEGLPRLTYRDATDAQDVADDLGVSGVHPHIVQMPSGGEETVFMPGATHDALNTELNNRGLESAPLPEQEMKNEVQQQQQQQQQTRQTQSGGRSRTGRAGMEQGIPGARTPASQSQQQPDMSMDADEEVVETFPIFYNAGRYKVGEVSERRRIADEAQEQISEVVANTLGPADQQRGNFGAKEKIGEAMLSEDGVVDIDIFPEGEEMTTEDTTRETPSQKPQRQQQPQRGGQRQQTSQQQMQGESFPAQSLPERVAIVSSQATMADMPDTGDIKSGAAEGFVIDALVDETTTDNMVTVRVSEPDGDNGRVMTVRETTTAQEVVDMALDGEGQPISAPEVREIRGGGRL